MDEGSQNESFDFARPTGEEHKTQSLSWLQNELRPTWVTYNQSINTQTNKQSSKQQRSQGRAQGLSTCPACGGPEFTTQGQIKSKEMIYLHSVP